MCARANFITVGDPAQAINRFIGAHPTLFLNLANPSKPEDVSKDGADTGDSAVCPKSRTDLQGLN